MDDFIATITRSYRLYGVPKREILVKKLCKSIFPRINPQYNINIIHNIVRFDSSAPVEMVCLVYLDKFNMTGGANTGMMMMMMTLKTVYIMNCGVLL